jgi:hypothetical protein
MALQNTGLCAAIIWFMVQVTCSLADKLKKETVPPAGCICPPLTEGDKSVHNLCGHEISANCSRHVLYFCEHGNITVDIDCPYYTAVTRSDLKTAHYCSISPYGRLARQCAFISDCSEELGLCGFPSLQAVKAEIRKLPTEVERRVHCNLLHYPQNCKVFTNNQPTTELLLLG